MLVVRWWDNQSYNSICGGGKLKIKLSFNSFSTQVFGKAKGKQKHPYTQYLNRFSQSTSFKSNSLDKTYKKECWLKKLIQNIYIVHSIGLLLAIPTNLTMNFRRNFFKPILTESSKHESKFKIMGINTAETFCLFFFSMKITRKRSDSDVKTFLESKCYGILFLLCKSQLEKKTLVKKTTHWITYNT